MDKTAEIKLSLDYVLQELHADNIIVQQNIKQIYDLINTKNPDQRHPLITVADQNIQSNTQPSYLLSLETLTKWLAKKVNQPYLRIDPLKIDVQNITSIISQAYASKLNILPINLNDNVLTIGTCEPFINAWEREVERITQRKIKRVIINPKDIERYLIEFYGVSRSIKGAINSKSLDSSISLIQNFEQLISIGKKDELDANDQHIVSIVDWLLQFAFEQRASDIHLEPRREQGHIRFRIDGALHPVHQLPVSLLQAMTSRFKSLGRMDVTDRRRPHDGRIKTITPTGKEIEMRLSTMPTAFGEKLVIRIFDPEMLIKSFRQIGFSKHDETKFRDIIQQPHGIILITGPTGSGKTTTLYSTLNHLARPDINICTIEDPIEMVEDKFNQMQVQEAINIDFLTGVRTLLRQDPDIIMIGEIRDQQTAEVAIQASLTGHLVVSSLHTNDATSAITRLIDIGIPPYLINATLRGVVAQRLLRTLCPHCKTTNIIDARDWETFSNPHKIKLPKTIATTKGCDDCRYSGYYGRIGIFEVLAISQEIKKHITKESNIDIIRKIAANEGMRSLKLNSIQKVVSGLTTMEEVYSTLPDKTMHDH